MKQIKRDMNRVCLWNLGEENNGFFVTLLHDKK